MFWVKECFYQVIALNIKHQKFRLRIDYIIKHQRIMPNILVYTTKICPYCLMAKRLLDKKAVSYTEINVDNEVLREEMMRKTQRRTVPQIYIDDFHVGGFEELHALDQQGKLDVLLSASNNLEA
jgi:glutaredoxin 3